VSTIDRIAIRHVDVERATVISALPFAAVVSKVAAAIGHPDMSEFARAVRAARTSPISKLSSLRRSAQQA
jgi:hypothetical protein